MAASSSSSPFVSSRVARSLEEELDEALRRDDALLAQPPIDDDDDDDEYDDDEEFTTDDDDSQLTMGDEEGDEESGDECGDDGNIHRHVHNILRSDTKTSQQPQAGQSGAAASSSTYKVNNTDNQRNQPEQQQDDDGDDGDDDATSDATSIAPTAPPPLVRSGWDAIASVNDCVSDLERELAALLSHHRKKCQVGRRAVSECEDRIKWLDELAAMVESEKRAANTLRDLLASESAKNTETEEAVRHVAGSQKTLTESDFFPLDLEEIRADARLRKLEDDANELKEVMKSLTEREEKSKARQLSLRERELNVKTSLAELDSKLRQRRLVDSKLDERDRTATRHENAIDTWSRTLDVREGECQQRRAHLDRCFRALERAEASLNISAAVSATAVAAGGKGVPSASGTGGAPPGSASLHHGAANGNGTTASSGKGSSAAAAPSAPSSGAGGSGGGLGATATAPRGLDRSVAEEIALNDDEDE